MLVRVRKGAANERTLIAASEEHLRIELTLSADAKPSALLVWRRVAPQEVGKVERQSLFITRHMAEEGHQMLLEKQTANPISHVPDPHLDSSLHPSVVAACSILTSVIVALRLLEARRHHSSSPTKPASSLPR